MAAYFSKDSVNRPGFAKLFFDAASEEREHAYKLIEYLSMRGRYLRDQNGEVTLPDINISDLVKNAGATRVSMIGKPNEFVDLIDLVVPENAEPKTTSGLNALKNALKLETLVTKSIRNLIQKCEGENFNHYHVSRFVTQF